MRGRYTSDWTTRRINEMSCGLVKVVPGGKTPHLRSLLNTLNASHPQQHLSPPKLNLVNCRPEPEHVLLATQWRQYAGVP